MWHHIIPRHDWKRRFGNLKGLNASDNKIELTLEQHIQAHELLFEIDGHVEDLWAVRFLSGRMGKEEVIKEICRQNQKKSVDYWKTHQRRKWTKEEKEARSDLYSDGKHPMLGRKQSEKAVKANRAGHLGLCLSVETKQKLSFSQKEAWKNSSVRKLVGNGLRGRELSLETKRLISEAAKKRWKLWKSQKEICVLVR